MLASSSFNDQPWRFIVCDKATDGTGWQNAFQRWLKKNRLDADILDDDFKETESAACSRAALNERFYAGQWGGGIE